VVCRYDTGCVAGKNGGEVDSFPWVFITGLSTSCD
jgi:hypothetical protein